MTGGNPYVAPPTYGGVNWFSVPGNGLAQNSVPPKTLNAGDIWYSATGNGLTQGSISVMTATLGLQSVWAGPTFVSLKRTPASLNPIKREELTGVSYRSSESEYEYHCPFGPASHVGSMPKWYLDGVQLNLFGIFLMQEILADMTLAPLWINHDVFRYPALWVLQNGPVAEYWDGSKYEKKVLDGFVKALSELTQNWWTES